MVWKEEPEDRETLKRIIDWMYDNLSFYTWLELHIQKPNYNKIINKCLSNRCINSDNYTDRNQLENPVVNYRFYLIFESLVLEHLYKFSFDGNGELPHLPLWVYHNQSQNMRNVSNAHVIGHGHYDDFYNSYKNKAENLDYYGEFGEFVIFLNDLMKIIFYKDYFEEIDDGITTLEEFDPGEDYKKFFKDVINSIVYPDWGDVLKKLPEDEQQKWNTFYEPEDWLYHGVV